MQWTLADSAETMIVVVVGGESGEGGIDILVRCLYRIIADGQDNIHVHSPLYMMHTYACFFICVTDVCMCAGVLTLVGLSVDQRLTLGCLPQSFPHQRPPGQQPMSWRF